MRRLLLALACLGALALPAAAAPSDVSSDPLERAALLAMPSVYRIDVVVHADALMTADGRRVRLPPLAREVPESGTAVAVAPGGWLVTAGHVAAPSGAGLARLAYQRKLIAERRPHSDEAAAAWVAENHAEPVGVRVVSRQVRQADAGEGADGAVDFRTTAIRLSNAADLALVQIDAPEAPALELDESGSIGTPVVSIGFGRDSAFTAPPRGVVEPAVRRGELGRTGRLDDGPVTRPVLVVTTPVQPGDSGGPVVDAHGRVRGIVFQRTPTGGYAERATEVRQLLEGAGVTPGSGRTGELFRDAMQDFWRLDLDDAQRGFAATLAAFPEHSLARREAARARELAAADFRLEGSDRIGAFWVALALSAAVAALACGIGLARPLLGGGNGTRLGARRRG
jgi:hypothetical protein